MPLMRLEAGCLVVIGVPLAKHACPDSLHVRGVLEGGMVFRQDMQANPPRPLPDS